jgi:chemotaxis protein methyltransferase CheR
MVEARLRKRLRQLGLSDFRTYVDLVLDPDCDPAERQTFLDHITTNKTDLFREPDHFDHLAEVALPALLAGRHRPRLTVWCAASSSGEEPYTIAMTLMESKRRQDDFDFRVLASDISRSVLEKAHRAVYPATHADAVPEAYRSRYLLRSRDGRQIKMARPLRQRVTFGLLNLMQPPYGVPADLDVIFCRNVLIYFDRPTQVRVVEALVDRLRPGGYLYLGHSESAQGAGPRVDRVGAAVYRRKGTSEGDGA